MTDLDTQPEAVAALFAPELDEMPAELRQRTALAEQKLAAWVAATPADVMKEASEAGFDLKSLAD